MDDPSQPIPYDEVLRRYKQLRDSSPDFKDWTLPQYSQAANEASGSDIYSEGLNDSMFRRASAGIDTALDYTHLPQASEAAGRFISSGFSPETQDMFGHAFHAIPRMVGVGLAGTAIGAGLAATAPVSAATAGALGLGAAFGLNTYGETGSVPQSLFSGATGAIGAGVAGPASQAALRSVGASTGAELFPQLLPKVTQLLGESNPLTKATTDWASSYLPTTFGQHLAGTAASQGSFFGVMEAANAAERAFQGKSIMPSKSELLQDVIGQIPFLGFDVLAPHVGLGHAKPAKVAEGIANAASSTFGNSYADVIEKAGAPRPGVDLIRQKLQDYLLNSEDSPDYGQANAFESRATRSDQQIVGELVGKMSFGEKGAKIPYWQAVQNLHDAVSINDTAIRPDTQFVVQKLLEADSEERASGRPYDAQKVMDRASGAIVKEAQQRAEDLAHADPQFRLAVRQKTDDTIQSLKDSMTDRQLAEAAQRDPQVAAAVQLVSGSEFTARPDQLGLGVVSEKPGLIDQITGRRPVEPEKLKGGGLTQPTAQYVGEEASKGGTIERSVPDVSADAQRAAYTYLYDPQTGLPTGRTLDVNNPESVAKFKGYVKLAMVRATARWHRNIAEQPFLKGDEYTFDPARPETFGSYTDAESAAEGMAVKLNADVDKEDGVSYTAVKDNGLWRIKKTSYDRTLSMDKMEEDAQHDASLKFGNMSDEEAFKQMVGEDWGKEDPIGNAVKEQSDEINKIEDPGTREAYKDLLKANFLDLAEKLPDERIRAIFNVRATKGAEVGQELSRFRSQLYRYLTFIIDPANKDFQLTKKAVPTRKVVKTTRDKDEATRHAASIPGATVQEELTSETKKPFPSKPSSDFVEGSFMTGAAMKKETLLPGPTEEVATGPLYKVLAPTGPSIKRLMWDRPADLAPNAVSPMARLIAALGEAVPKGRLDPGWFNQASEEGQKLVGVKHAASGKVLNFFEQMEVLMKELSKGFTDPRDFTQRPEALKGYFKPVSEPKAGFLLEKQPKVLGSKEYHIPGAMTKHSFQYVDAKGKVQTVNGMSNMMPFERILETLRTSEGTIGARNLVKQFLTDVGSKLNEEQKHWLELLTDQKGERVGYSDTSIGAAVGRNIDSPDATKGLYVGDANHRAGVMLMTYHLDKKFNAVLDAPPVLADHLIHELGHSALQALMARDDNFRGRVREVMKAAKEFVDDHNQFQALKRQFGDPAAQDIDVRSLRSFKEDNHDEFMSEFMMSGHPLKALLWKIPVKEGLAQASKVRVDTNLFQRLWSVIKDGFSGMFGKAEGETLGDRMQKLVEEGITMSEARGLPPERPDLLHSSARLGKFTFGEDVVKPTIGESVPKGEGIKNVIGKGGGGDLTKPKGFTNTDLEPSDLINNSDVRQAMQEQYFPREGEQEPASQILESRQRDKEEKHPYANAPDTLMGFASDRSRQKGYDEQKYKHEQYVKITWDDGDSMVSAVKGLNKPHAMERARREWPTGQIEESTKEAFDIDVAKWEAEHKTGNILESRQMNEDKARAIFQKLPVATSTFATLKTMFKRRGVDDTKADIFAGVGVRVALMFKDGGLSTMLEQKTKASGGVAFPDSNAFALNSEGSLKWMYQKLGHEVFHVAASGPWHGPLVDIYNDLKPEERNAVLDASAAWAKDVRDFPNREFSSKDPTEFWADVATRIGAALTGGGGVEPQAIRDFFNLSTQESSEFLRQGIQGFKDAVEGIIQVGRARTGWDEELVSGMTKVTNGLKPFMREIQGIEKLEDQFHSARSVFPDAFKQEVQATQKEAVDRIGQNYGPEALITFRPEPTIFESRKATPAQQIVTQAIGLTKGPDEKLGWWSRVMGNFFGVADEHPILRPIVDVLMSADGLAKLRIQQLQTALAGTFSGGRFHQDSRLKDLVKFIKSKDMNDAFTKVALELNESLQKASDDRQLDQLVSRYVTDPESKRIVKQTFNSVWNQHMRLQEVITNSVEHRIQVITAMMVQKMSRGATSVADARKAADLFKQSYDIQKNYVDLGPGIPEPAASQVRTLQEDAMKLIDPNDPYGSVTQAAVGTLNKLNQALRGYQDKMQEGIGWWTSERRFGDYGMHYRDKTSGNIEIWRGKTKEARDAFIRDHKLTSTDIKSLQNDESGAVKGGGLNDGAMANIDNAFQRVLEKVEDDPSLGKDAADILAQNFDLAGDLRAAMAAKDLTNPTVPRKFGFGRKYLSMFDVQQDYINAVIHSAKNRFIKLESDLALSQPGFATQPDLANYAKQHISNVLKPDTKAGRFISSVNFTYFMGMNLGTMIMEPFQQLMMLAPVLTKNGASLKDTYKYIGQANAEWGRSIGEGGFNKGNFKDPQIQDAMKRWRDNGQADAGIVNELQYDDDLGLVQAVRAAGGSENFGLFDLLKNKAYNISKQMQRFYGLAPGYNSEIALIAAYRMLRAQGVNHDQAIDQAAYMKSLAMITGGKANRPVGLFSLPRTIAQTMYSLQSYSAAMLTMMGSLTKQSFVKKGLTSAQQYQVRLAAGQMLATQFAAGGALGMPFVAAGIAALQKLFPDMNIEQAVRDFFGNIDKHDDGSEGMIGQLLTRGVPNAFSMGPDFSSRFALGGTLGVSPYTGVDASALFGPTGSLVRNGVMAAQAAKNGNAPQAIEDILPTGFKNFWKAASEGNSSYDSRGRQLVNDLTGTERAGKVAGLEPNRVTALKTGSRLAAINETAARESARARNEKMADVFLSGNVGQVQSLLNQQASETGESVQALASRLAERIEEKTLPMDPREQGGKLTAAQQASLVGLLGHRLSGLPTQVDREMLRLNIMSQLGVPTTGHRVQQAAGVDYLLQQTPGLVKSQALALLSHSRSMGAQEGTTLESQ